MGWKWTWNRDTFFFTRSLVVFISSRADRLFSCARFNPKPLRTGILSFISFSAHVPAGQDYLWYVSHQFMNRSRVTFSLIKAILGGHILPSFLGRNPWAKKGIFLHLAWGWPLPLEHLQSLQETGVKPMLSPRLLRFEQRCAARRWLGTMGYQSHRKTGDLW